MDDLILVNFTDAYPDSVLVDSFMQAYELTPYYEPLSTLPVKSSGPSYTYIFQAHVPTSELGVPDFEYFVHLMRDMYLHFGGEIANACPNFVNHSPRRETDTSASPTTPPSSPVYSLCGEGSGQPDDPFLDYQWYINNEGFNEGDFVIGGFGCAAPTPDAVIGADAKICGCWDAGLSGTNIKVGVIGSGNIVLTHNDLQNQTMNDRWDCTGSTCVPLVPAYPTGILEVMSGIIGAEKNNNKGIAGIAENCTISPLKIGDEYMSDGNLIIALQKSLSMQYDILAIDFFSIIENPSVRQELLNHMDMGRNYGIHHGTMGTILIAPAGHTTTSTSGSIYSEYPAAYYLDVTPSNRRPEVIGVINSNRFDKLETGQSNNPCFPAYVLPYPSYSYPSNFGSQYDIAVPSANFYSTESGSLISRADGYSPAIKQSANAVAICAGVAALLLDDNYYQTNLEMRERLTLTADKVGGFTYNPDPFNPPHTLAAEFANGRINCLAGKNFSPAGTNNVVLNEPSVTLRTSVGGWIVSLNSKEDFMKAVTVYSPLGEIISRYNNLPQNEKVEINAEHLAQGIYYIRLSTEKGEITLKASR